MICFNKKDLVSPEELENLQKIYENSGCRLCLPVQLEGENLELLKGLLKGKTTTVAGPSGVGKSSLINALGGVEVMETGMVCPEDRPGTTHHETFPAHPLGEDTYIMDTPGFSSLYVEDMEKEELKDYIPEFYPYRGELPFQPLHPHP